MKTNFALESLTITVGQAAVDAYHAIPAGTLTGYDIETMPKLEWKDYPQAGLDPHTTDIRLVQFYTPSTGCLVIDLREFPQLELREDLRYITHFAIFEMMHSRMHWQCQFAGGLEDTMLMEQLIFATRAVPHTPDPDDEVPEEEQGLAKYKADGYSLANVMNRHFGIHRDKSLQTSDWSAKELTEDQIRYAAADAFDAYHLGVRQIQILRQEKMQEVYKLQREMLHVVADMQIAGIAVDWVRHAALLEQWKKDLVQYTEECTKHFGFVQSKKGPVPLNVNSSIQLGAWVREHYPQLVATWPRTPPSKLHPQGSMQFGSKVLPDYADLIPGVAALLKQKKVQKLVSSFGESLIGHKNPVTGRIHPSYKLGATSTGRMSCNSPNLQQSPKEPEFRSLFVTAPGTVMVGGDFNQIETQVQGQMSGDEVILQNYALGNDIYMTLAKQIWPGKEITKQCKERQVAKQLILSLGYGMGARKFRWYCKNAGVTISEEEAFEYHSAYHRNFSTYSQWCNSIRTTAELTGEAVTKYGKRRRIASDKIYTQAPNLVIQGTASELLQLTMVILREIFERRNILATIVATIHDEILLESNPIYADHTKFALEDAARTAFETLFKHKSADILQANIGESWAKVK